MSSPICGVERTRGFPEAYAARTGGDATGVWASG